MLLYLAFIATLNLCAGYALGVYFGSPFELNISLPSIKRKKRKPKQAAEELKEESTTEQDAPAQTQEEAPDSNADMEIMSGLQAFQEQLAQMGQDLQDSQDDAEAFDECAKNIQDANHAYLETAQQQIDKLPPEDECRKTVEAGAEEVGKISGDFDSLVEEGTDSSESRAGLVSKSNELAEKVADVQQEVRAKVLPVADGAQGLALLDDLLGQITELVASEGETKPGLAVLIRADPPQSEGDAKPDAELSKAVQTEMPSLIRGIFEDMSRTAVRDDGQYLLLMEEKGLEDATAQAELLRQQIEETTFVRGENQLRATVTCAIADLPGAEDTDAVLRRLEEAMAESTRLGANRTYHHDGKFPTPIVPEDANVEPRTLEV